MTTGDKELCHPSVSPNAAMQSLRGQRSGPISEDRSWWRLWTRISFLVLQGLSLGVHWWCEMGDYFRGSTTRLGVC